MDAGRVLFEQASRINKVALDRIRKGHGRAGDTLLSHKGTVGKVAYVPPGTAPFVCSPQTTFWRSLDVSVINPRFLTYTLRSPAFISQLEAQKGETDMAPYVSLTQQRQIRLLLPHISDQQAIAEVLGALDDKITANTALAAKAEELSIEVAASAGTLTPLGSIAQLSKRQVQPGFFGDQMVDHFSLPAFDAAALPSAELASTIKSGKFEITEDCVLLSKLNPRFPRVWRVAPGSRPALASTEFLVLKSPGLATQLLWSVVSQPAFSSALDARVAGTSGSHQRVRPADALAVEVKDPRTLGEDAQSLIEHSLRAASLAREESRTLAAVRDALLPQLMSGKLHVRDAEDVVTKAGI